MAESRVSLWRVAAIWAGGAAVACSFLPLWELWYIGSWEASADRGSLWWVLLCIARRGIDSDGWPKLEAGCQTGAAITAALSVASALVGLWFARRISREPVAASRPIPPLRRVAALHRAMREIQKKNNPENAKLIESLQKQIEAAMSDDET